MIGISEGIVLADRYQLVRRQFERGIGAGWVAVDTESSSEVWVQFTRHGGLEAVGELLRRHGHAGMPAVLDTGELRMIVDSSALALRAVGEAHATHVEIVIEFVVCRPITGRAMSAKVARRPLTPVEALTAVAGLAEALELALGEGYSHGWLTGESVWLTRRGACALDLALGLCAADGLAIDVDQEVTGCYAPERLNGGNASEAADVFALGWLLYTLLIGYAELQTEYARVVAEAGAATTLELLAMWRKRARLHVVELLGAESELALLLIAALSERAEERPALGAFHPGARSAARGLAGAAPLIVPVPTARHKGRTEAELAAAGLAVAGLTAAGVVEALHSEGTSAGGTAGTESLADSGYGSGVNGSEVAAGAGLGAGAATGSAAGAGVASGAGAGTESVAEAGVGSESETLALATAAGAGALVGAGVAEAIGTGGAASGSGAIGAGSGAGAGSGYTTTSFGQTGLSPSGSGSSGSGSGSGSGTGSEGSGSGSEGSGSGSGGSGSAAAGSGSGAGGAGSGSGTAASGASGGAAGYGASASETGTLAETESAESAARWRRKVLATSSASVVGALVVGVIVGYLWGHSSSKTTTIAATPATVTVTVTVTVPVTVPAGSGAGAGATPAAGTTTAPGALATTAAAGSGATATPSAGGSGGSGGTPVAGSGGSAGGLAPTSPAQAFSQLTQEVQTGKSSGQISASTASSLLGAIGAAKSESQGSTSYYTKVRSLGSLIQSGQQSGAIPESLAGQLNGLVNYLYAGGGS